MTCRVGFFVRLVFVFSGDLGSVEGRGGWDGSKDPLGGWDEFKKLFWIVRYKKIKELKERFCIARFNKVPLIL